MSITVSDLLTAALAEIRIARAGDVIEPDAAALSLTILNELLDAWNAEERSLYTSSFSTFTITPNLQPHTIGLAANSPTWVVTIARPVDVRRANLVISNSIRVPLTLRESEWWMDVRARAVTAAIPTDLFYADDWPNGSVYLYPVPTTAYTVELELATLLAQVAATDTIDLPPGYQQALRLTLAEMLAAPFGQTVSPATAQKAREARARVWGNNDVVPSISTRDAGMPGVSGGGFDFRTGFTR